MQYHLILLLPCLTPDWSYLRWKERNLIYVIFINLDFKQLKNKKSSRTQNFLISKWSKIIISLINFTLHFKLFQLNCFTHGADTYKPKTNNNRVNNLNLKTKILNPKKLYFVLCGFETVAFIFNIKAKTKFWTQNLKPNKN